MLDKRSFFQNHVSGLFPNKVIALKAKYMINKPSKHQHYNRFFSKWFHKDITYECVTQRKIYEFRLSSYYEAQRRKRLVFIFLKELCGYNLGEDTYFSSSSSFVVFFFRQYSNFSSAASVNWQLCSTIHWRWIIKYNG